MNGTQLALWDLPEPRPLSDRTPLPGHDPGTFRSPGCPCPDCEWLRLTD